MNRNESSPQYQKAMDMAKRICTPKSRINIEIIIQDVMSKSNFNSEVHVTDSMDLVYSVENRKADEVAQNFFCPITHDFPVVSPIFVHGTVYDKEALQEYIFLECQKDDLLLLIEDPVSKQPIWTDGSTLVQDLTQDIDKIIALKDSFESREDGRMAWDKAKNDRAKDLSNKNKNPQDVHEAAKKNLGEEMVENKIPKVEHEVKKRCCMKKLHS